jgi:3D (Asp-Asp-Asp) domain-containing protein
VRLRGKLLGNFYCTGYQAVVAQCDANPEETASGRRIVVGKTIAVDPRYWGHLLRQGAHVYVEGYGEGTIDDTGSKIKGRERADLSVGSRAMADRMTGRHRIWLIR